MKSIRSQLRDEQISKVYQQKPAVIDNLRKQLLGAEMSIKEINEVFEYQDRVITQQAKLIEELNQKIRDYEEQLRNKTVHTINDLNRRILELENDVQDSCCYNLEIVKAYEQAQHQIEAFAKEQREKYNKTMGLQEMMPDLKALVMTQQINHPQTPFFQDNLDPSSGDHEEIEEIYEIKYNMDQDGTLHPNPQFLKRILRRKLPNKQFNKEIAIDHNSEIDQQLLQQKLKLEKLQMDQQVLTLQKEFMEKKQSLLEEIEKKGATIIQLQNDIQNLKDQGMLGMSNQNKMYKQDPQFTMEQKNKYDNQDQAISQTQKLIQEQTEYLNEISNMSQRLEREKGDLLAIIQRNQQEIEENKAIFDDLDIQIDQTNEETERTRILLEQQRNKLLQLQIEYHNGQKEEQEIVQEILESERDLANQHEQHDEIIYKLREAEDLTIQLQTQLFNLETLNQQLQQRPQV